MWFLFGEVSSSSVCFGWAALLLWHYLNLPLQEIWRKGGKTVLFLEFLGNFGFIFQVFQNFSRVGGNFPRNFGALSLQFSKKQTIYAQAKNA